MVSVVSAARVAAVVPQQISICCCGLLSFRSFLSSISISMNLQKVLCVINSPFKISQLCGMKRFLAPKTYKNITLPDKPKLKFMDKVPTYQAMVKPPKMQKKLKLMMGPEKIHNELLHKQYGIIALSGGRLSFGHMEMARLTIGRKIDISRMFAIWRVDPPWQPVTKKGQGQRMGGGKGSIDHYVTPVKAGRVILEVAGQCEYKEVQKVLEEVAKKLPFKAIAISQENMDNMAKRSQWEDENNANYYTMQYMIQNNLGGCQRHLRPNDMIYYGKYM